MAGMPMGVKSNRGPAFLLNAYGRARYPAARTASLRDSHSGPAGQLGRMKSRGAAVTRENRAARFKARELVPKALP